jgi:hypothetical protein
VVRESVALPAGDPGCGLPTVTEEMIARGPHTGMYYELDNKEICQVIGHVVHGWRGWNWVQGHQQTSDGHQAYRHTLQLRLTTLVNPTVRGLEWLQTILSTQRTSVLWWEIKVFYF